VVAPRLGAWVMFSCFATDAPLQASVPCPPGCRRRMEQIDRI
jgi:hypothetical protein